MNNSSSESLGTNTQPRKSKKKKSSSSASSTRRRPTRSHAFHASPASQDYHLTKTKQRIYLLPIPLTQLTTPKLLSKTKFSDKVLRSIKKIKKTRKKKSFTMRLFILFFFFFYLHFFFFLSSLFFSKFKSRT
jgi:hypothetical protein